MEVFYESLRLQRISSYYIQHFTVMMMPKLQSAFLGMKLKGIIQRAAMKSGCFSNSLYTQAFMQAERHNTKCIYMKLWVILKQYTSLYAG